MLSRSCVTEVTAVSGVSCDSVCDGQESVDRGVSWSGSSPVPVSKMQVGICT